LPKVDLHRHLEGSLRLATLMEIAEKQQIDFPHDEASARALVQVQSDEQHSPETFLRKFAPLHPFYNSRENLQRFVDEALADAAAENIRYLELRFTPFTLARTRDFPLVEVVDWILEAARVGAERHAIEVGLIASINRHDPMHAAEQVAGIAVERLGRGIVGLGLAGDEVNFPAQAFAGIFSDARSAGLNLTVHAGEWDGAESVRQALQDLHAGRIGHGGRVLEDPAVVDLAKERGTVFEICLSSNLLSGAITQPHEHPLLHMIQSGLKVTLNSDDPSIAGIRLTDEYCAAIEHLGLSTVSLQGLILTAAQSAFLPAKAREALQSSLLETFF